MKIKTYLPVFTGFYNNIFFNPDNDLSREIEEINQIRSEKGLEEITENDATWDYTSWTIDSAKHCCEKIEKSADFIKAVKFESVQSPKEYNFTNDSINCEIDSQIKPLKDFICENLEDFEDFIKDRYTSCSGFISYYSNDSSLWLKQINKKCLEKDGHILGTLLNFYFLDNISEDNISEDRPQLFVDNFEELTN